MPDVSGTTGPVLVAIGVVIGGLVAARLISRWMNWPPGGPITLLVAAPLIPHIEVVSRLSTDDLLPLVGLTLLVLHTPRPALTRSRFLLVALVAVAITTLARVASTIVHGSGLGDVLTTLTVAVARPAFLVAVAVYVAASVPAERRTQFVAQALAVMGTFEGLFSLTMFTLAIRGVANRPVHMFETLGGCDFRITGTLGLSANHIGAVFVVTIPMTIGVAITQGGLRRWLWCCAAAVQGAALLLTFTRASIALAALAALALLMYHRQFRLLLATAALGAVLSVGVTTVACQPTPPDGTPLPGESIEPGDSGEPNEPGIVDRFSDPSDRLALWYTAAQMTIDYPLFGVGIGNMVPVLKADPPRYMDTPFGRSTSSAHNTILLAGAETGVVGALSTLVLNLWLALVALKLIVHRGRKAVLQTAAGFAIAAFLVQGMVNNLFTVPATGTLLVLLVGAYGVAVVARSSNVADTAGSGSGG